MRCHCLRGLGCEGSIGQVCFLKAAKAERRRTRDCGRFETRQAGASRVSLNCRMHQGTSVVTLDVESADAIPQSAPGCELAEALPTHRALNGSPYASRASWRRWAFVTQAAGSRPSAHSPGRGSGRGIEDGGAERSNALVFVIRLLSAPGGRGTVQRAYRMQKQRGVERTWLGRGAWGQGRLQRDASPDGEAAAGRGRVSLGTSLGVEPGLCCQCYHRTKLDRCDVIRGGARARQLWQTGSGRGSQAAKACRR